MALSKRSPSFYMIIFIFLYVLFALGRIRGIFAIDVDGLKTSNEVWLILIIVLISFIYNRRKDIVIEQNKYYGYLKITIVLLCIIIALGVLKVDSISQYIYAILLFIAPLLLFFVSNKMDEEESRLLIKIFIVTCLVYSVLTIVLSTNYFFFRELIGNPIDPSDPLYAYKVSRSIRVPMMMGTSIAVSYYFNITLPLCFYTFYRSDEKIWRLISVLTIGANVTATLLLSSRNAAIAMGFVLIYSFIFISDKKSILKTLSMVLVFLAIGVLLFTKFNLARLLEGLDLSNLSETSRLNAAKMGLYIFSLYPILGSGMGRFYHRVFAERYITVDGMKALIDPHNMYILIMSELGIMGFILFGILLVALFKSFSLIKEKQLKHTAYLTILTLLICSIGGSHLFISISFSAIFWIYMGVFNSFTNRQNN